MKKEDVSGFVFSCRRAHGCPERVSYAGVAVDAGDCTQWFSVRGEDEGGVCVAMLSFQCNQGCLWPGGEGDGVGTWEEPLIVGVNSVPSC